MHKILVLLPAEVNDSFEFFPFLHGISDYFENAQINILMNEGCDHFFDLLPFEVNTYHVSPDQMGLMTTGKLAYQLKDIFNITHFFNLRHEKTTAYVGRAFRAKEKIGFATGLSKMLYTHAVAPVQTSYLDEESVNLIAAYLERSPEDYNLTLENEEKIEDIERQNYFFAIDELVIDSPEYNFLSGFIDELKAKRVVLWSEGESEALASLAKTYPHVDLKSDLTRQGILDLVDDKRAFITNYDWLARTCIYRGVEHLLMTTNERDVRPYKHYKHSLSLMKFDEQKPVFYMGEGAEASIDDTDHAVDLILDRFKI